MKKLLLPLMLITLCACNPQNKESSSTSGTQTASSTQQQTSSETTSSTNNESSSVISSNPSDSSSSTDDYSELDQTKNDAIITLTNEFNNYDIDDYSIKNWNAMIDILTQAEYDIYNATDTSTVTSILAKAIEDLDAVPTFEEEKQNEKTVIELNDSITIGSQYRYALTNLANPNKVMRVKIVLDIDFNGADQSHIYWGGEITIGSSNKSIASTGYEEKTDVNEDDTPESTRQIINVDVNNLTSTDNVEVFVTYAGGSYTIKIASISFYYNNDYELKEEKVMINKSIYNNQKVNLAYSELVNKGDVYKIELNLTVTGNQTYTGGSVYVTGCQFSSANTVNIGDIMIANQVSTGSVYIYPEEKIDLSLSEEFSFTSWWAPASEITLNYVTVYTKN